ncbi:MULTISPECIES: hypothetical protein [Actinomycetes]|uniref:Peptidase C39-like domain-containing protein n=2 Tax=Actinomycetes TaxID=1760 RepID=A0ABP6LT71_9MICC
MERIPESPASADLGRLTGFDPRRHAFRFPNRFVDVLFSGRLPPVVGRKVTWTGRGRCGGMAFSALDHLHAEAEVPPSTSEDFRTADGTSPGVPPDGHPLADHIRARQRRSMVTGWCGALNGIRYLTWSAMPTGWLIRLTRREVRRALASLDDGVPVVLGLVSVHSLRPSALGRNHQAVCHGYRRSPAGELELLLYDPNHPYDPCAPARSAVVLRRREGDAPSSPYQSGAPGSVPRPWRGFFVARYRPRPLPPTLR